MENALRLEAVETNTNGPPTTEKTAEVTVGNTADTRQVSKSFTLMGNMGNNLPNGVTPNPRRYDHKLYYDMYERHTVVNAAVNTIVKVSVNTGFEFLPRTVSTEMIEAEVQIAKTFFHNSRGFKSELTFVYQHLEIYGEAYLYVVPTRSRKPSRLKAIPPWTMNIKADKHGNVVEYYQDDPDTVGRSATVRYKPHEIIHIKHPNPRDMLYGLSPLETLKSVVLTDLMAENFNKQFFKNGATTGTVFIFHGATDDQLSRMDKYIKEKYTGDENAHLPLVIDGDIDVHNASPAMSDMGFERGREAIRAQILAVLGVPPAKLGHMETANRSNSKEQDKSFRTETILPLQNLVETAISDQLLRDIFGLDTVIFNHSDADVRDRQEQGDLWAKNVQNGLMTINEVRKLMGYDPIEGGDTAFIMSPTGAVPVVDLELYFRLAKPNEYAEELHDGHDHVRGSDGSLVGPTPKKGSNNQETVEAPTTKSMPTSENIALTLLASSLMSAESDDRSLRHAWAFANDLPQDNTVYQGITKSLESAVKSDDELLRNTYVERVRDLLQGVMKGG